MKTVNGVIVTVVLVMGGGVQAVERGEGPLRPEQLAAMDLAEMQRLGDAYVQEMNDQVSDVLEMLSEAQKANDLGRVQCLSAVMTSLKGMARLSEQYRLSLRQAVIANDRSIASQEFVKLTLARNKVREWHAQAKGCGGPAAELVFEGEPQVERTTDPDLPVYDTRKGLDFVAISSEPPPSVSPFY